MHMYVICLCPLRARTLTRNHLSKTKEKNVLLNLNVLNGIISNVLFLYIEIRVI